MQICRKYETQDEKILPFVESTEDSVTSHESAIPSDIWDVSGQVNFVFIYICMGT